MSTACNYCDHRDCPTIEQPQDPTALGVCRTNLRADLLVIQESIADLINDGSIPPPMCAWCGTSFGDMNAIRDHLASCAKHPLAILAEKRRVALEATQTYLTNEGLFDPDELLEQIKAALAPVELPALAPDKPTATIRPV